MTGIAPVCRGPAFGRPYCRQTFNAEVLRFFKETLNVEAAASSSFAPVMGGAATIRSYVNGLHALITYCSLRAAQAPC
jgi:hypothetical protein